MTTPESFTFRVALLVSGTYTFEGADLIFRQGVRRIAIPLAGIRAFAVRERPAFFGMSNSQLICRVETADGVKIRRTTIDPRAPACAALLAALRARVPAADCTALAWPDAAARLGIKARPWYEGFFQPRVTIGVILLGANAAASSTMVDTHDRAERLGQGIAMGAVSLVAIFLIVTGLRRARRAR